MIITTNLLTFIQIFVFVIVLVVNIYGGHSNFASSGGNCLEIEMMALLKFKAELVDDYDRLFNWESFTNCCEWNGVLCDNRTDHVVALDLHGPTDDHFNSVSYNHGAAPLRGKISPSLLQLTHLQYLDLSLNDFSKSTIPSFIGSLTKLRHLNLSHSEFGGPIPHHIGNLSVLRFLDLGGNRFLTDTNLDWLSGSSSLQYLNLNYADLEASSTWLQVIHKLTALKELHLSCCFLPTLAPISVPSHNSSNSLLFLDLSSTTLTRSTAVLHSFLNMSSSFTYIDFSGTNLAGSIPNALGNLMSLFHLDLSYNSLNTSIPDALGNLTSLSYLDLSLNQLHGEFPQPPKNTSSSTHLDLSWNKFNGALLQGIVRLPNLEYLDLSSNNFEGRLPHLSSCVRVLALSDNAFNGSLKESIEHLFKIEYLDVGFNQLEGVFNLSNLPHLRVLDLSFNLNLTLTTTPSWIHPVQFQALRLADCKLGPYFPTWLQNQNQLEFLDISNSGIIDTIPAWFWGNIYECKALNMSHNQIYGVIPDLSSKFKQLMTIDLSSNEFNGSLPPLPPFVYSTYMSRNRFSGSILNFCNFKDIRLHLDVSNNRLSGEIPQDCFMNLLSSGYLNLANNNFSGEIPTTNNFTCSVLSLHLRNNNFIGEIPRSLINCIYLRILDLGGNELSGKIPVWLGERIPELGVLILKSNKFNGSLPSSICQVANIQVLDISLNKITGTIPNCVNNFSALSSEMNPDDWKDRFAYPVTGSFDTLFDDASVIWKGNEETYINTLGLLKMIDLSSNELSGEIPPQLLSLVGLVGLNLSGNNLVGLIPKDIDELRNLNFLDLSRNNLSGSIPPTLSKLSNLGVLDLSFNNFWGRIPWDTHMQTFEASSFSGNPRLCGPPLLSRPCPGDDQKPTDGSSDDLEDSEEKFIKRGFYISLLLGFVVAFWVVFWSLYFNKWWNVRICMSVADWLYVKVLVNKRRLMMRFLGNAS